MLTGFVPHPPEFAERYRRDGYWTGELLGDLLRRWPETGADRVAVVGQGKRHTYAQLDAWADRLAAGLVSLGVGRHDRVVVQLPNCVEFVVVCVALFRVGALPVLALPAHRRAELTYLCEYSDAVALVVPEAVAGVDHRELATEVRSAVPGLRHVLVVGDAGPHLPLSMVDDDPRDLRAPDPSDVAFFLLSGGTTGLPKLIPRTHDDYAYQMRATAAAMNFDERGAYLAVLPIGHNAALGCPGVLGALRAGGRVVMATSPSPDEAFRLIKAEDATLTTLMPALLPLWMDLASAYDADLSRLTIEVGGAVLPPAVGRRVREALGATLTHWFGMAEGVLCFTRPDDGDEIAATTQGTPMSAADELRVVDDHDQDVAPGETGQLLARGPCTLRGYYNVPDHNAAMFTADGFLRTGDLVQFTPEGRLVVTGRIKDVINRGGEKVSVDEVESHLVAHPAVRAVALVPVADRVLGEKSCAVVVPRGDAPNLAGLHAFLRERGLADFKLPDRLEVVEALPHTGVGKIDRRALSARFAPAPRTPAPAGR